MLCKSCYWLTFRLFMQVLGSDTCHLSCFKSWGKKLKTCSQFLWNNSFKYLAQWMYLNVGSLWTTCSKICLLCQYTGFNLQNICGDEACLSFKFWHQFLISSSSVWREISRYSIFICAVEIKLCSFHLSLIFRFCSVKIININCISSAIHNQTLWGSFEKWICWYNS